MHDPWEILNSVVLRHPSFRNWLEQADDARDALHQSVSCLADSEGVFRYASLFYPRFIEVEGCVMLANQYTESNWECVRVESSPREAAALVNHVHVRDVFSGRADTDPTGFVDDIGGLLAFFWQRAVDDQFPHVGVKVEYADGIVDIWQEAAG